MSENLATCRVCGAIDSHASFIGREMMFGTREEFEYFQCKSCDCLQIKEIPRDLGVFYPSDYYSLRSKRTESSSWLRYFLLKQRFRSAIFNRGHKVNRFLAGFVKMPDLRVDGVIRVANVLRDAGVRDFSARFLDVGCGSSSRWLESLRVMGFRHLHGVDPFIDTDVSYNDIVIFKRLISKIKGAYDLITFHHSLEHIPDQQAAINNACRLLTPRGVIVIRIPIVSSYAWRYYGTNWVEMDPPRHLYLHSRESIRQLGEKSGLKLISVICDSKALEFYGSEQYIRDIPLAAENSYWLNKDTTIFTPDDIEEFRDKACEVNERGDCGRACFFFKAA